MTQAGLLLLKMCERLGIEVDACTGTTMNPLKIQEYCAIYHSTLGGAQSTTISLGLTPNSFNPNKINRDKGQYIYFRSRGMHITYLERTRYTFDALPCKKSTCIRRSAGHPILAAIQDKDVWHKL